MYNPKLQNVTSKGIPLSVTMLGAGFGSRVARVRSGLQEGSMIYIPRTGNQFSEAEKTGSSETCFLVCLGRERLYSVNTSYGMRVGYSFFDY